MYAPDPHAQLELRFQLKFRLSLTLLFRLLLRSSCTPRHSYYEPLPHGSASSSKSFHYEALEASFLKVYIINLSVIKLTDVLVITIAMRN